MQQILHLQTADFKFSIWCKNISERQQVYFKTLIDSKSNLHHFHQIKIFPKITLKSLATVDGKEYTDTLLSNINQFTLIKPLFFENTNFQIEWIFTNPNVNKAYLAHRLISVNNGFRFSKKVSDIPARLMGNLNSGNDIGWLRLPMKYQIDGIYHEFNISFEILPTKMDMYRDLPSMYRLIDKEFPLWRFSLAKKTEQDISKGKRRNSFILLWLAHFKELREQFERGLKIITNAPHSRLQSYSNYLKANRLKGKIPYKLAERVKNDISNGCDEKKYKVEKKHLSLDTVENRFIKMVVDKSSRNLNEFYLGLKKINKNPDKQMLSSEFLKEINSWRTPLKKIQTQSFLRDVGKYKVLQSESLVLQQKTGYSTVYRIWQELKFYMDVFANQSSISLKSIAEIYEIWCFLSIRNILINFLMFTEKTSNKNKMKLNNLEYKLQDGFGGAFSYTREDGLKAKLAHEPVFTKKGNPIRTYLVRQKPDILLEVTFPDGKKSIWIFDAKYRIKNLDERPNSEKNQDDLVPEDAINQMHRYRDALIRIKSNPLESSKSRPVFGAFALYPGSFNQNEEENPYSDAIKEISIGAFSLLPSQDIENGCFWLTNFLKQQIGLPDIEYPNVHKLQEDLYIQEAARIPYYGMKQSLYPDLVFTVSLGGMRGRDSKYNDAFKNGSAKWYHIPITTFNQKYKMHIINEVYYLAIALKAEKNPNYKEIKLIWPVNNIEIIKRNKLTLEQAGKKSNCIADYYLFKLGKPLELKNALLKVPHRPIKHSMKLTTLSNLEQATTFNELKSVYKDALRV